MPIPKGLEVARLWQESALPRYLLKRENFHCHLKYTKQALYFIYFATLFHI